METEFDTPDIEQRNAVRGAQVIQIESSRLVPMLVALAACGLVLAGLGVGLACWALSRADAVESNVENRVVAAEKEALIAKMRTEGFTRALIAKGIDPYPHITGEDP